MMEIESFDRLEAEITKAVDLIGQLKREKERVEKENGELKASLEKHLSEIEALRSENEELRRMYQENAPLIERKEEIKEKIESMLSKLDSVIS